MISASKSLVAIPSSRPLSQIHHFDWLKHSRIGCPHCKSSYVMAVRRTWLEKLVRYQNKKFWCQDCGEKFWKKD
ncbi:hypothetical protein VSS37_19040 [Candidatus Thiothrix sp. Deng01]|uniref:Transposase zinc-ribbon domain-containing protein n=1 Tax=Candidatus Thiothrix phosphatis TaxID=3112415 RepID=A0ABU6D1Z0_9GAMM|nr:hypothetical protein [Candidatus Thiothrix sp. Deng01]MEB4593084.1 hypothetical protein [Candidatus Thiothrix sp. Deng01]